MQLLPMATRGSQASVWVRSRIKMIGDRLVTVTHHKNRNLNLNTWTRVAKHFIQDQLGNMIKSQSIDITQGLLTSGMKIKCYTN